MSTAGEMSAGFTGAFLGGVFESFGLPVPPREAVRFCREVEAGGQTAVEAILSHQLAAGSVMVGVLNMKATAAESPAAADVFAAAGARLMAEVRRTAETLDAVRGGRPRVVARQLNVANTQQVTNVEGPAQVIAAGKLRRGQRK